MCFTSRPYVVVNLVGFDLYHQQEAVNLCVLYSDMCLLICLPTVWCNLAFDVGWDGACFVVVLGMLGNLFGCISDMLFVNLFPRCGGDGGGR